MSKLWAEVWSRPGAATYGRVIDDPLEVSGNFHDGLNQIGDGQLQLSNRSTYFDQILKSDPITAANSRSSTVKIFSEEDATTPIFEWLPNQLFPSTSKNDPLVQVSGLGIKALLGHARLEPYDWDGSDDFAPDQPDWQFGAQNVLSNGDFESNQVTNQTYSLEVTATGGTFTFSDGVDTTNPITITGTPSTDMAAIESALQTDIAAITDVAMDVEGTSPNTYGMLLFAPPFGVALTIAVGSLTGGTATLTQTEMGGFSPAPWHRAQQIQFGVNNDAGNYDAFEVSDAQNHTPGGSYSLLIDPGPIGSTSNRGAGAQQVVSVQPGTLYQASIWVYTTSATDRFRLGIFTETSELIAWSNPSGVAITPNTWTQITLSDTLIPDNVSTVLFRLQCTNSYPVNPVAFYVDDALFYPGLPATTIGEIIRLIYDHAIDPLLRSPIVWDDGSGTDTPYLTLDFSDTIDSNGNAWADAEISTVLTMRMSYSQIMAHFARDYDYEYRIVPNNVETGTYLWQVYNPGTMQTDYTAAASPGIQGGANDVRRNVNRFLPSGTDTVIEGLGRVTARARNAALMTALGRIESARLSREAPDLTAAGEAADEAIASLLQNSRSLNYTLVNPPDEPMSDYVIGDLLVVDDPPEVVAAASRFVDVTCSFTPNTTEWEVQFGSARIISPDAAVASAVGGLLAKFEYPFPEPAAPAIAGGGEGGAPTLVVAASDASDQSKAKADFICTGTNDEAVIRTAQDSIRLVPGAGGRVLLTEGTFNIGAYGVIVVGQNESLIGMGIDATILDFSSLTTGTGAVVTAGSGAGATIRDFSLFIPNGGNSSQYGIRVQGTSQTQIENILIIETAGTWAGVGMLLGETGAAGQTQVDNCRIWDCATGIRIGSGGEDITISNTYISSPRTSSIGIDFNGTDHCTVIGNYVTVAGVCLTGFGVHHVIVGNQFGGRVPLFPLGIQNEGDSDWLIEGNNFVDTSGIAFDLGSDNCAVIGNRFDSNGQVLFDGGSFSGCLVADNIWDLASSPAVDGVIVFDNGAEDCAIVGNLIQNAGGDDAIRVETGVDVLIEGNIIGLGAHKGIVVNTGTRVHVVGNQVKWAGEHGIDYDGDGGTVVANLVFGSGQNTTNTWDNINLSGSGNLVHGNQLIPAASAPLTRYGLNIVSGTSNAVYANMLGDSSVYGTADSVDSGTTTILTAAGGAIGGQFAY